MKAWLCRGYGGLDVLTLADVPRPEPQAREVLVRIRATTVTVADWRVRTLTAPKGFGPFLQLAFGLRRPRQPILGGELAGTVEAVGSAVTRFRPGDAVLAFPDVKMGCHAEFRALPEEGTIVPKPAGLSLEEAAALPFGGTTAQIFLRKAKLQRGERVLVVGASGNVGSMIVQLAKHEGAAVTAVTSTANADLVRSLGADHVIDYTREDFRRGDERYDVIADTVGATSFRVAEPLLTDGGRLLAIAGGLAASSARRGPGRAASSSSPARAGSGPTTSRASPSAPPRA